MRIFTIFWSKILNILVRIHSVLYRWVIKVNMVWENYVFVTGAHPEFFLGGGGAYPEAIYNLCLILKICVIKSCCKYTTTLSATAFVYIQI
jgi:hypothetical protein